MKREDVKNNLLDFTHLLLSKATELKLTSKISTVHIKIIDEPDSSAISLYTVIRQNGLYAEGLRSAVSCSTKDNL